MNKKIIISVSVIAVLFLYLIITNVKWSSDIPTLSKWDGKSSEFMITRANGTIKLYQKENKWVVNDEAYPADPKVIAEIEKRFKDVRLSDLISKKGFYSKYDLTPDKYIEVIIKKGDTIFRKFKIGKKSSTNRHTFVKINDQPEIYLAEGTFDLVINKTIDDFRDKEIVKISHASISDMTVDYQGAVYTFMKIPDNKVNDKKIQKENNKKEKKQIQKQTNEKWICKGYDTIELDKNKIDSLLGAFDPMRALSFPEIKKESLPQRICMVQVKANQKDIVVTMYNINDKYYVTISDSPYVYGVDKWTVDRFFIKGIDAVKATEQKK